jgi:hypothetical protein
VEYTVGISSLRQSPALEMFATRDNLSLGTAPALGSPEVCSFRYSAYNYKDLKEFLGNSDSLLLSMTMRLELLPF